MAMSGLGDWDSGRPAVYCHSKYMYEFEVCVINPSMMYKLRQK